MVKLFCIINNFYYKYKDIINFNKNIFISAIVTAILDTIVVTVAVIFYRDDTLSVSFISMVADFLIFNSILIVLLHKENKKRYSGNTLRKDALKLITTLGLSEISYLVTKFFSTYILFTFYYVMNPSEVSIVTTLLAWIIYILTANLMIKKTRYFD